MAPTPTAGLWDRAHLCVDLEREGAAASSAVALGGAGPAAGEAGRPPGGPLAPGSGLAHLSRFDRKLFELWRITCPPRERSFSFGWNHPGRIDPMIGGAGGIREMFGRSCDFQDVLSSSGRSLGQYCASHVRMSVEGLSAGSYNQLYQVIAPFLC